MEASTYKADMDRRLRHSGYLRQQCYGISDYLEEECEYSITEYIYQCDVRYN